MRAFLMLFLTLLCGVCSAKDFMPTADWSGTWVAEARDYRCSVRVSVPSPIGNTSLDLVCAFGPTAVAAQSLMPAAGAFEIPLLQALADLGSPPAGVLVWGEITLLAVCDQGPMFYASVTRYAPAHAEWVVFRPASLDRSTAAKLCGGAG